VTTCPRCGNPLLRSEILLIGHIVLKCVPCGQYRIEDDEVVIGPCADPLRAIRTRADAIDDDRRWKEAMTSSIDDPRWEKLQ
jgi:hypothetical protein